MKYIVDHVVLSADETPASLRKKVAQKLGVSVASLHINVVRRTWVKTHEGGHIEVRIEADTNEFIHNTAYYVSLMEGVPLPEPKRKERPVVVGFGIKGVIAAFLLAKQGLKPIVLEKKTELQTGGTESAVDAGMLFSPDELDPVLQRELEAVGIVFEGIDASEYLPPAFLHSIAHKLYSYIENEGGQVLFNAEYLETKKRFGKVRGVSFTHNGVKTFIKTRQVILANGAMDDSFYLGCAISSTPRLYHEYIYGKSAIDPKTPNYYLPIKKTSKSGVPFLFLIGLPKATMFTNRRDEQVLSHALEFAGKGKNAVSYVGCAVTRKQWEQISRDAYFAVRDQKIPFCTLDDFFQRKGSLRLGSVKPTNPLGAQLVSMYDVLGKDVGEKLRTTLSELSRPFPFLQEKGALLGGLVLLHGRNEEKAAKSNEKQIHVIAVSPEKSIDFACVASASLAAVRALLEALVKAH